ncbi:MAG: hypothetical protein ABI605_17260 [Rhizobacter sp.]
MTESLRNLMLASAFMALTAPALAGPAEVANSAASHASGVAVKVEGAVKRGAQTAASAVEHGVKAAASAVQHGASVAGNAIDRTARRIGLPTASSAPSAPQ